MKLQEEDPEWRQTTRILADNAPYHKSGDLMDKLQKFEVPMLFLGMNYQRLS